MFANLDNTYHFLSFTLRWSQSARKLNSHWNSPPVLFLPLTSRASLWLWRSSGWCKTIQSADIPFQSDKGKVKGHKSTSSYPLPEAKGSVNGLEARGEKGFRSVHTSPCNLWHIPRYWIRQLPQSTFPCKKKLLNEWIKLINFLSNFKLFCTGEQLILFQRMFKLNELTVFKWWCVGMCVCVSLVWSPPSFLFPCFIGP